jgi:hypothetical protein
MQPAVHARRAYLARVDRSDAGAPSAGGTAREMTDAEAYKNGGSTIINDGALILG